MGLNPGQPLGSPKPGHRRRGRGRGTARGTRSTRALPVPSRLGQHREDLHFGGFSHPKTPLPRSLRVPPALRFPTGAFELGVERRFFGKVEPLACARGAAVPAVAIRALMGELFGSSGGCQGERSAFLGQPPAAMGKVQTGKKGKRQRLYWMRGAKGDEQGPLFPPLGGWRAALLCVGLGFVCRAPAVATAAPAPRWLCVRAIPKALQQPGKTPPSSRLRGRGGEGMGSCRGLAHEPPEKAPAVEDPPCAGCSAPFGDAQSPGGIGGRCSSPSAAPRCNPAVPWW